ncbi:hypothetical protein KOAAANKH_01551 [Brevundimonas sp. NIBR10]|uniref:DUF885 domain-containing protein n=1 Tax=Brevundimonas sp. NIBR10 TaxID=3015997 RepID=UPI0022F1C02C|nr:DUF885 family protein [Brevundimonas sp. NIBR10]WGM46678.1 hypothetical protein KOAAANKH_01551 [Brevundimonas sp. NIBR10]
MIDRRRLLVAASALAALSEPARALAGTVRQTASPGAGTADAALTAAMDGIVRDMIMTSPQTLTMLGLDKGPAAPMKAKLDDQSQAKIDADKVKMRASMAELSAIDRNALTTQSKVYFDSVKFFGETVASGSDFPYGGGQYPSPYTISQLGGAYQSVPDFLDSQHSIETAQDAEAYLSRLSDLGKVYDQETERMRADFGAGAVPPDFVIDRTTGQMDRTLDADAAGLTLVTSVARRAEAKGLAGDWSARALAIVSREVLPALRRQRDALAGQRPTAVHDAGVWRLPQGEAYYDFGLRFYTTTGMTGQEIHQMGLEQVAELSARADVLLKAQGLTQGTVGARIASIASQVPGQLYPNTDEAKAVLLTDLNAQMERVMARMPEYFGRLPKSGCDIRRVPKDIEAGAPGGYYQSPSLDGSRPGAYYINLRDTAEWPKYTLPTLTYHEAVPGHHFQIALQQENASAPMLMKILGFSAYSEGWGLYSEQLADEIGMYEGDPWGQIGSIQSLMFRATRLVVDSGLHYKRWSREEGIRYMVDTLGDQESSIATEVERYAVWPGQASSYKVGHSTWVRLREAAKAKLGPRFDIKGFHDVGLAAGGVPLTVLEEVIDGWVASRQA